MSQYGNSDDGNRELMEGYARWSGGAFVLAAVVLAALRGWYDLALIVVCAVAGGYLGAAFARRARSRRTLENAALAIAVSCVVLAALGFGGLLGFAEVGGLGLWGPFVALLGAALPGLLIERERRKDAEKFRMMLRLYPHPDGGRWDGEKMERATQGGITREVFADLERGRGGAIGPLGLSPPQWAAMAQAMDFPLELWHRKLEWWQEVYRDWEGGTDVSDKLQEWDCVTPERAAERLGTSRDEVLQMVSAGELEGREDREGNWQVREEGVFRKEMEAKGKDTRLLPPHPRDARPGRTGSGNYHDRFGRPF